MISGQRIGALEAHTQLLLVLTLNMMVSEEEDRALAFECFLLSIYLKPLRLKTSNLQPAMYSLGVYISISNEYICKSACVCRLLWPFWIRVLFFQDFLYRHVHNVLYL